MNLIKLSDINYMTHQFKANLFISFLIRGGGDDAALTVCDISSQILHTPCFLGMRHGSMRSEPHRAYMLRTTRKTKKATPSSRLPMVSRPFAQARPGSRLNLSSATW